MIIEVIPRLGGQPLRLEAAQLIVYNDAGTPVMAAGEFGPQGAIKAAHAADRDFNQTLRVFGYGRHQVVSEPMRLSPPPAGASLLREPA